MSSTPYQRVIQIELNEISKTIIDDLIARGHLPNFRRMNQEWYYAQTASETRYEHLEPWIQWVTAHTGKTFDEHGIFRLGDADNLQHPQIWEVLSDSGIESAIFGSMNCTRGIRTKGGIFFPDPWAKANEVYPESLRPLWEIISKKVQGHAVSQPSLNDAIKALQSLRRFNVPLNLYARIAAQFVQQKIDPLRKWRLAMLFDELLANLFLNILEDKNIRFYTLFLNCIAHYQHHYWRNFDRSAFHSDVLAPDCRHDDNPIKTGYIAYDAILGRVLERASLNETLVIVTSGLSQVPFTQREHEGGMNYYRLRDHQEFLMHCGLGAAKAYPMMSRDWQVSCSGDTALESVREQLEQVTVNGTSLFKISKNTEGYLFLETAVTKQIPADTPILLADRTVGEFADHFVNIAVKSGHHTGIGCLWVSDKNLMTAFQSDEVMPLGRIFDIGIEALGTRLSN